MVNAAPVAAATVERRRLAGERGASEVFMLLMIIPLLLFAGLAYDAGMAFTARRSATNTAAAAARAGADQVEEDIIYLTGETLLDRGEAESVARNFVANAGAQTLGFNVGVGLAGTSFGEEVYVRVGVQHETVFLRFIGMDTLSLTGEAFAAVRDQGS